MEVNALVIKNHRTSRAFTQQHLADACDVSLRTIQRVERYGVASSETLMSLSAVFGVDTNQLLDKVANDATSQVNSGHKKTYIIMATIALLFGFSLGSFITYLFLK
jgi:transcriptional regulator with XRE-family HTH domain